MRDIRVQVLLTPEEFLALDHLADASCESHSGLLRRLLLRESRLAAASLAQQVASVVCSSILADPPQSASTASAHNLRT